MARKSKVPTKKTGDNKSLIVSTILLSLKEKGPQRFSEIMREVWPKIEKDLGMTQESFQSVILHRVISDLENDGTIERKINIRKKVVFDICPNEKAKEKANALIYGSKDNLIDFRSLLILWSILIERPLFDTFPRFLDKVCAPYWARIEEAVATRDVKSFNEYKNLGQQFVGSMFGMAVDTLWLDYYKEEAKSVTSAHSIAIRHPAFNQKWKKYFQNPEKSSFQTEWVKEMVERLKYLLSLPEDKRQEEIDRSLKKAMDNIVDCMNEGIKDGAFSLQDVLEDALKAVGASQSQINEIMEKSIGPKNKL